MSGYIRWAIGLCALGLSAGCDNPSDVGDQAQDPPVARVVVLGQPFSPEEPPANGLIRVDARSGSDLLLSGKESDSDNAPILAYEWEPADSATGALVAAEDLIVRNNSTVLLKVPFVREDRNLRFRLTVRDANGLTGSAEVEVAVKSVPDPARFLTFLDEPRRFFVYTRLGGVGPLTQEDTARFRVEAQRVVTYLDRSCPDQSCQLNTLSLGGPETIELEWPVSADFGEHTCDPNHFSNPVLTFDIPSLKVDDITREIQQSGGGRDRLIELRDIDIATLSIQVTLRPLSGPDVELCSDIGLATPPVGNVTPSVPPAAPDLLGVQSTAGGDGISQTLSIDLTDLTDFARTSTPVLDSASSAAAYYNTIDPNASRTKLSEWLFLNGFNLAAPDLGSDAHAVYTNNFDLGFGRDMYVKLSACDEGVVTPGNCDVASVVINYASLEAAAKKIGPIVAVAMEYSRPECPSGETSCPEGQRFTKFYVFAPDLRGDFVRISSVDLDGRGEKFVPQACVVCHAGTPAEVVGGVYGRNGDLNSGWLTWDLDSFLYSDTDPGFSRKAADDELRGQYTRDGQQEAFRLLNYYAWLTMYREDEFGSEDAERYRRARELVVGWYGDAEGFQTSGTTWTEVVPDSWSDSMAAGAPAIYTDVFAQHCRACHVLHIPPDPNDLPDPNDPPDPSRQVPIGSYAEFVEASGLAQALQSGTMPMARMTMDRFWVSSGGAGSSAGGTVKDHLQLFHEIEFEVPGAPAIDVKGFPEPSETLERGGTYRLSALDSEFAPDLVWALQKPLQSDAALLFSSTPNPVLTGIDERGLYVVSLRLGDEAEIREILESTRANVPIVPEEVMDVSITVGEARRIVLNWTGGEGTRVASVVSGDPTRVEVDSFTPSGELILGAVALTGPTPVTVTWQLVDDDGDPAEATFNVRTAAGITVGNEDGYAETRRQWPAGGHLASNLSGTTLLRLESLVIRSPALPTNAPIRVELINRPAPDPYAVSLEPDTSLYFLPPPARMTRHASSSSPDERMEDPLTTISYRACYEADLVGGACPDGSPVGTITVDVVGRSPSWPQVYLFMGSTCESCHGLGQTPELMRGASDTTFERLCNYQSTVTQSPIVVPGNGSGSRLFQMPGGLDAHNVYLGREVIRDWITDGAYFTSQNRGPQLQKCP